MSNFNLSLHPNKEGMVHISSSIGKAETSWGWAKLSWSWDWTLLQFTADLISLDLSKQIQDYRLVSGTWDIWFHRIAKLSSSWQVQCKSIWELKLVWFKHDSLTKFKNTLFSKAKSLNYDKIDDFQQKSRGRFQKLGVICGF